MGPIVATLETLPKPIWIALAVIGFFVWWPLGVAILAYLIWSRSMMCCGVFGRAGERGTQSMRAADWWRPSSSGNQAFDDYRAETLRRLEEEHRAFQDFLIRLRTAKDKAEFDQFMAERAKSA